MALPDDPRAFVAAAERGIGSAYLAVMGERGFRLSAVERRG